MQPHVDEGQNQSHSHHPTIANSLLVADCGAVFTKVSLFGLVEGQYRLMARAEAPTTKEPQEDITAGIIKAINEVEFITGRHFIADGRIITPEQENGDGVDVFVSTISAGGPLHMVVLGSVTPNLEELAKQAVSGLYAEVQALPAPSFVVATTAANAPVVPGATSPRNSIAHAPWSQERVELEWERQLGRLRDMQPQAALIVGMADGPAGPNPLQEACQLLINAAKDRAEQGSTASTGSHEQTSVLYAGAPQYVDAVRRLLTGVADVTLVDALNANAQLGSISVAAGTLHERHVIQHLPGYRTLMDWSLSPPVATATSLSSLVRFLAQHYAMNVAAVDVGGNSTTIMIAGEQGEFLPKVNAGIGVSPGVGTILQRAGLQRITRWVPFHVSEDEIRQFVLNRILHPQALPENARELQITQAFAREAIGLTIEAMKGMNIAWMEADLVLATGGVLAHAPKYGQVALMLLDSLQPKGVTSLVLDRALLIAQLGAVATVSPITAVQVNENDAVVHRLGTCVIPFGAVQPGKLAIHVNVEHTSGRQQQLDVMGGEIKVIPLQPNEQALLSLFPAPGVDVGLGPGERARAAEEIDGGLVGLIIDARGRPLTLPADEQERHAKLLQWSQELGA